MAMTRKKTQGRSGQGRFVGIPHSVMNHADWPQLSPNAIRLLMELVKQYNGHNNGDLTAAWSIMCNRGFNSKSTLTAAIRCLMSLNFVVRTREGYFCNPGKRCALYAVTWQPINECRGKSLEIKPTTAPPRAFSMENNKPAIETVLTAGRNCT
jgi:hypothetical protein